MANERVFAKIDNDILITKGIKNGTKKINIGTKESKLSSQIINH